jgi:GNAT superfamily N-acetyltransferase
MKKQEFQIKDGFINMDFNQVTGMLEKVYWSVGIKEAEVIKGAKNSALLVGAFNSENQQIGFARVISDKTRFAYIMDVVVDESFRKQGIGKALVDHILNHHELKDVYQWLLRTKDAHGVYRKFGFKSITNPDEWMGIMHSRPER